MRPPHESPTRQAVSSATPNSSMRGAPLTITSAASSTTAPSTQPPDTEPRKLPSPSITRCDPTGRGAEPQVSTTVASATSRPSSRQASAASKTSSSLVSILGVLSSPSRRCEAEPRVTSVAKRLSPGAAAAAERCVLDPVDGVPRPGNDFDGTYHLERSVLPGPDRQKTVPPGKRGAWRRLRFAGRDKAGRNMRTVAIGLVLGLAAAAKRGSHADRLAIELDFGVNGERAVLAHGDRVDLRRALLLAAVAALDPDRAGRAVDRHPQQRLCARGVRVDPRALNVGLEDPGLRQNTSAGVDAEPAVEANRGRFSLDDFDGVAHPTLLAHPQKWPGQTRSARPIRRRPPLAKLLGRETGRAARRAPCRDRPCWRDCGSGGRRPRAAASPEPPAPWPRSRRTSTRD